ANATECDCNPKNKKLNTDSLPAPLTVETTSEVPPATTVYRTAREISVTLEPSQNAFVYVFEFSALSPVLKSWFFAGSSANPSVTYTVPNPCTDYQFRVFAIMPTSNNNYQLIVYRSRAVPMELPPFSLQPDQIKMEQIVYNKDNRTINVYINWKNPRGYTDSDIYGYESPAVYPIQCLSPEEQLPTPIVETFSKGGRLKLVLPIEMLEQKCRLWFEVRMLPMCIRMEPFTIQQTVELDCSRLQTIDICRHSLPPQCTEVVDIWGAGKDVTFMWAAPSQNHRPLYYVVRYGPAEMHGAEPVVTWEIVSENEIKVDGDSSLVKVMVEEDKNYGAQICAVYDEENSNIKFDLVKVIPFACSSCSSTSGKSLERCGECSKIENPDSILMRRCHPKGGIGCVKWQKNEDSVNPANLLNSGLETSGEAFIKNNEVLSTDNNESMNNNLNMTTNLNKTVAKSMSSNKPLASDIEETIEKMLGSELRTTNDHLFNDISETRTTESIGTKSLLLTTLATTTTAITTSDDKVFSEETTDSSSLFVSTSLSDVEETTESDQQPETTIFTSTENVTLPPLERVSAVMFVTVNSTSPVIKNQTDGSIEEVPTIFGTHDVRLHQATFKMKEECFLDNNVMCEFGCLTNIKCFCPLETHVPTANGGCILPNTEQENSNASNCLRVDDVNATWDSQLTLLKLSSTDLYHKIQENDDVSKVYLEFGKLDGKALFMDRKLDEDELPDYNFADDKRYKVVIEAEEIIRQKFFIQKPFPFYLNEIIEPLTNAYGMRICTYSSNSQASKQQSRNEDLDLQSNIITEKYFNDSQFACCL
ncbi:unnamed protein product, partial [Enterobius vermicularis]|uniref:A2M domain-containing protein n=1 Tax=Enterobius vermicularis TaxID=51028 RepID=A0A0N4V6E4_ENTVE